MTRPDADTDTIALRRVGDRRVFPVKPDTIIGRIPQADICIDNEAGISRKHARIRREGAAHVLLDLGSLNGTTVNGQLLDTRRTIEVGDILVFDQQRFEVIPWVDIAGAGAIAVEDAPTRIADPHEAHDPALIRPAIRPVTYSDAGNGNDSDNSAFLDAVDREWSRARPQAPATPAALTTPVRRRWPFQVLLVGGLVLIAILGWWLLRAG